MDKSAIKNFAIWARRKLIDDISYKAGLLGVTEKGIAEPLPQSTRDMQLFDAGTKEPVKVTGVAVEQRRRLVAAIRSKAEGSDLKSAFQYVVEEVAYTWFNRLIAVRFMEVNNYLPSRIRVLSSENPAKAEPDAVTHPFDADLSFTAAQRDEVMRLKDLNMLDELFRMLFIMQCNKLHKILPRLFEPVNDYTELLLNISFTDKEGIVYRLTHDIAEDDFNVEKEGQVEIIGWLYQYYNADAKDKVFEGLRKNIKITKDAIPAATQLFTPDWIVRYMVENSLGRLWAEGHEDFDTSGWKYCLEEAQQEPEVAAKLSILREERKRLRPEDIKCIDPCMGSGHILVYMFDVLMQIYASQGYVERDAASLILQKNLYGLDIDDRAAQLAYFAVMMKARQYDRYFFDRDVQPHVYAVPETTGKLAACSHEFGLGELLYSAFHDGKEYGSLLDVGMGEAELNLLKMHMDDMRMNGDFTDMAAANVVAPLWDVAMALVQKYDVVVTNPPYMGASNMNPTLNDYIKEKFADYKSDFFSAFIVHAMSMAKREGYLGFFSPYVWMFIQSYEKLREKLYNACTIETLIQFEYSAFEEATVPVCTFAFLNSPIKGKKGCYFRLTDFRGGMEVQRQKTLEAIENHDCGFYFEQSSDNFSKIPGAPVAYWVSEVFIKTFRMRKVDDYIVTREGMATADNGRFLRLWHEVSISRISFNAKNGNDVIKWVPYNKGGEYRKWFGNNDYIVNWENNGFEIKNNTDAKTGRIRSHNYNGEYGFIEGATWSSLSSGSISLRYCGNGFLFDSKGAKGFSKGMPIQVFMALVNSCVGSLYLSVFSPTIDYKVGDVILIPVAANIINNDLILRKSKNCIDLCHVDWDSFETSWDFQEHPFIRWNKGLRDGAYTAATLSQYNGYTPECSKSNIELCWLLWQVECNERFNRLKSNEEELNRIFIDIYGLQDELTPEVEDKDVTVRRADLGRDIRSLLSYAVGCMFGRYSLDCEGLAYAGGDWDDSKYRTFLPDRENCIPITDEEYFDDDIVSRFCNWLKVAYGAETLEENLDFIASALGNKGNTSREVLRNYFLNDFFKDHTKIYKKRPIYWMFDSGRQSGFKALVYMHRWNADTVGNLRVEYLHRMQRVYEKEIERMQETIDKSSNNREVAAAQKRRDKLTKQLKETKEYDVKVAHIALRRIEIDLDDGVKVNYGKVQTDTDGKNLGILSAIK